MLCNPLGSFSVYVVKSLFALQFMEIGKVIFMWFLLIHNLKKVRIEDPLFPKPLFRFL